jgi:hypothetical protein
VPLSNLPLIARNLGRRAWRRTVQQTWARAPRQYRHIERGGLVIAKRTRDGARHVWSATRHLAVRADDARQHGYLEAVRGVRYWEWARTETWDRIVRDLAGRRQLRHAARGTQPVIVGPWLSEVGFEVLYWIPFLRWFCHRYRIDRERVIAVSRGGAHTWYEPLAGSYVDVLDLFTPEEFAALNASRQEGGGQKQHIVSGFDEQILARVRGRAGLANASVCHPSTMFRLLREFWLGNESLQYVQRYTTHALVQPAAATEPLPLPDRFVAVKFYTGRALPPTDANRIALGALVARLAQEVPVVTLETGVTLDEHADYAFRDVPGVISAAHWMTPQNNLSVQTEIIRRAERFVGTCGGLAWLAPMLGTPTVAVFADDHLLSPHLYAAREAFASADAAPFAALDLRLLSEDGLGLPSLRGRG